MQEYNTADLETHKTIAADCNSAPEMLEELSGDENRDIRLLVASNPNTPAEVLFELSEEFPEAVTANPIFDILILENPGSGSIRLCLARSSSTSQETLARLSDTLKFEDERICRAIARNGNTPIHLLEKLASWEPEDEDNGYGDEGWLVHKYVALNPKTPLSLLEKLAKHESYNVRKAVVKNPKLSVSTLEKLAGDEVSYVWKAVAKHPKTPISVLKKLADNIGDELREKMGKYPNSLALILKELTDDDTSKVLQAIIEDSKTPKPALKCLEGKSYKEIRQVTLAALQTIDEMGYDPIPF